MTSQARRGKDVTGHCQTKTELREESRMLLGTTLNIGQLLR